MAKRISTGRCKVCNALVRCDRMELHTARHSLAAAQQLDKLRSSPPKASALTLWPGDDVRFKEASEPKNLDHDELYRNSNRVWHLTPDEERRHPLIENKRQFVEGETIEIYFSKYRRKVQVTEVTRAGVVTTPSKTSLPFKAILRG